MTASVGLRHLFCRRQDLCCGLQIPDDRKVPPAVPVMLTSRYLRRLNRSKNKSMADLQAKSTQPAVSSIQQCAVSKKAPKELLCCEASSRKTGCTYAMGHKFRKLQNRKVALSGSTTLTQEQKEKFSAILQIEYMSSEESAEESGEDEHMGERLKVLLIHTLPWRNQSVNEMFQSLDRKNSKKKNTKSS
ncbi:hypothetical protein EMCRGX_G019547 [Ephydatia muelleri]